MEMKNSLEGFEQAEEIIIKCEEDRTVEIIQFQEQKGKIKKKVSGVYGNIWDTIKGTNILIVKVPRGGDQRAAEKREDRSRDETERNRGFL